MTAVAVSHLRPTAELAERVLLPDDPHRALAVAQTLLEKPPRMFNHTRGLWGYSGIAADGEPLTIQSTGMGGPSAAIVCEELIALGAARLVRIGTCASLADGLALGALVAPESVLALDGASTALGAAGPLAPDPELLARLVEAGAAPATSQHGPVLRPRRAPARARRRGGRARDGRDPRRGGPPRGAGRVRPRGRAPGRANGGAQLGGEALEALGLRLGEAGYAALRSR